MAAMKGQFKVKNIAKYKGNPLNVTYRSSWEFKVMMNLDHDPNVIQWNSEEIRIAYLSPLDNRVHTYYPDFYVKRREPNGKISETIIEVKPFKETVKPKPPAKTKVRTKNTRYIREAMTYGVNMAKWAAAEKYCAQRGLQFVKLTENELFGKVTKG